MAKAKRKPARGRVRIRGAPKLKARVWVEFAGGEPTFTDAGADLLEQIIACGSLSEAARRLRFSYRRAWMLVDAMNRRWPAPIVITAVGGEHGGGTRLTELGELVLRTYRDTQLQVEQLLGEAERAFARAARDATRSR